MQISLDSLEIEKNEHDPFAQGQGGHPSAECSLGALQPAHGSLGAWEPDSRPVWKWVGLGVGVGAGRHMPVGLPAQREGARTNRVRSSDSSRPSWG